MSMTYLVIKIPIQLENSSDAKKEKTSFAIDERYNSEIEYDMTLSQLIEYATSKDLVYISCNQEEAHA
jgi:hypothetical protein